MSFCGWTRVNVIVCGFRKSTFNDSCVTLPYVTIRGTAGGADAPEMNQDAFLNG